MGLSLKRAYEAALRKGEPRDPETFSRAELWAHVLQDRAVARELMAYSAAHPELWRGSAADVLEELVRLPGVGQGKAFLYVSIMLLVRSYLSEALQNVKD